jgi:hypothetical protein
VHTFVQPHLPLVAVPDNTCSLVAQLLKVRGSCPSAWGDSLPACPLALTLHLNSLDGIDPCCCCACLQVARTCHVPKRAPRASGANVSSDAELEARTAAAAAMAAGTVPERSNWKSREEAMLRTGVWTGLAPSTPAWQPSDLGGTHVFHRLGRYGQDVSGGSSDGRRHTDRCNKHQRSNRKLIPGIMLLW